MLLSSQYHEDYRLSDIPSTDVPDNPDDPETKGNPIMSFFSLFPNFRERSER